jgi:hypothetical protein
VRHNVSRGEIAGIGAGVAVWIVIMVLVDARRRRQGGDAASSLAGAATLYLVLQGAVALLTPAVAILLLYMPTVLLVGRLGLRGANPPDGIAAFVLTCACGAQVLACLVGIERLPRRLRSLRRRP